MPKKPTKAGTSWRTLMRRAKDEDKAGKPKVAAALRKQAAAIRHRKPAKKASKPRSEVMKKAWATRRARVMGHEIQKVLDADTANDNGAYSPSTQAAPGHGEIIGGAEYLLAEQVFSLSRKKGGKDKIQELVTLNMNVARAEGQNLAEIAMRKKMVEQRQLLDRQIVCAFIAEVEAAQTAENGLHPSVVWSVNPLTIVKIVDALNQAGYSANGMGDQPTKKLYTRGR